MSERAVNIAAGSEHRERVKAPLVAGKGQQARGALHPRRRNQMLLRQALWAYLFIAPFCLLFLIFSIGPYIYSFVLSFDRYAGFGTATPVGLRNYISILQYHVFWTELWNTIFYWLAHAIPLIPIAFLLAFLVRSKFIKGQRFWKPVIFLPQVMTIVAVSLVFQTLFSTQYGVVNQVFHTHIQWMENYAITKWVVVLMLVWQGLGFWFVVFLAGLTSIDPSLEEAAIVDGASVWQRLRFVIIPLMRNIFLFAFAIDAISSMRLYTQPNVLVSRASLADPEVAPLLNLLVSNLQGGSFGQSAAVGWLLFIITIAITAILFGVFRATGGGE
jgi:ABC-type sugar transport system permease subunit